jgi:hypothetical protein
MDLAGKFLIVWLSAASTRVNRHDFGASWNSEMQDGGVVVGDDVFITLDVEAILDEGRA